MSKKIRRPAGVRLLLWLRKDIWRKLISLFFALLLYFYIYMELQSEPVSISDVPVEIILPQELMDVEPRPVYVTLRVKANRNANPVPSMLRGQIAVEYAKFVPGKLYTLTLTPEKFNSPFGVRVIQVDPHEIQLNLQRRLTRDVPVRVTFSDRLSADYKSVVAGCVPSSVRVTGPEQIVKELKAVSTRPIPLSESVTEGFEYVAELEAPSGTAISPSRVTCQIDIVKNFEQRTFPAMPVMLLNAPGLQTLKTELLDSSQVDVTVHGLAGAVSALTAAEVRPYLDISHIDKPGIYEITTGCYVKGEGLDVKEIRPSLIRIKVTK